MSSDRRRLPLTDRDVQGSLAFRMTTHWLLFVSIAAGLTLLMSVFADPFRPLSAHVVEAAQRHGVLLVLLVALVPVFIWDAVKFSHRFVGPMVRFRGTVRDLAEGKVPADVRIRERDFWGGFADEVNEFLGRLRATARTNDETAAAWRLAEEIADRAETAASERTPATTA